MAEALKIPSYEISWEECDRITLHSLEVYRNLAEKDDSKHPDDIEYNKKLVESIDFLLRYLGGVS